MHVLRVDMLLNIYRLFIYVLNIESCTRMMYMTCNFCTRTLHIYQVYKQIQQKDKTSQCSVRSDEKRRTPLMYVTKHMYEKMHHSLQNMYAIYYVCIYHHTCNARHDGRITTNLQYAAAYDNSHQRRYKIGESAKQKQVCTLSCLNTNTYAWKKMKRTVYVVKQ